MPLALLSKVFIMRSSSLKNRPEMELVSLTSAGKILLSLNHGKHIYSQLKFETELSDRWLTIKLEELEAEGIIKKSGRWYGLSRKLNASAYELSLYMHYQAKRMARELAKLHCIRTVILFGGVAQYNAHEYSDLDMIIVVSNRTHKVKEKVTSAVSKLESKYHVMIESLILSEQDFLDNVFSHEGSIIYGIAEGSEILIDKTGKLAEISYNRAEEIKRTHDYLEEERIWLRAR